MYLDTNKLIRFIRHLVLMCLVNCKYLGSQLKPRSRSLIRRSSKKVNHPFIFF